MRINAKPILSTKSDNHGDAAVVLIEEETGHTSDQGTRRFVGVNDYFAQISASQSQPGAFSKNAVLWGAETVQDAQELIDASAVLWGTAVVWGTSSTDGAGCS